MFKLVIQDDEGKTTVVPLIRDEITIGRKEGNTIRLTERNVSRRHARILRNQGEVHIEDLGSYNGIRVNNSRIAERVSLRVSDQVQIGDYKLYLKAEGVEQVDDARTMPIERVDALNGATEVMPAVPAVGTQPPAPAAPAAAVAPTAPQLVGNPARTLVAIADTDPQGRPVASAATIDALKATPAYGKLCIVSSNFAGKEFELTRPQMIIGRTPENDIQIDHRSISRNHAKLTREPESGRYTISDLQSSNGVRVNEQDYGKVELRRGDLVDLGHVRLRFVEPGEDFVFSRDAQISDVSETGGKKGLLVAIVLGVVVLGAVAAFFIFRGGNKEEKEAVDKGSGHSEIGSNNGTDVAINTPPPPQVPVDAAEATPTVATDPQTKTLLTKCTQLKSDKKWPELQNCANDLMKHDQATAQVMLETASHENKAAIDADKIKEAVKNQNLRLAQAHLSKINPESVYYDEAKTATEKLDAALQAEARNRLQTQADQHNCKQFDKLAADYKGQGVTVPGDLRCEAQVAANPVEHPVEHPIEHPKPPDQHPGSGSAVVVVPPPQPACDVDALKAKGEATLANGDYANAIGIFRAAYKCKPEAQTLLRAYLASCKSNRGDEAKTFFRQLPQSQQSNTSILQICLNGGIDPRSK